jgi:hypothetical protein
MKGKRPNFAAVLTAIAWLALGATAVQAAEEPMGIPVYDEASYTAFVESKMKELDALYLQFCATCGVEAEQAARARMEFLTSVRELMEYMNGRFDSLDPKKGAALSETETLVSIHALTMLVDILAATQLEQLTKHPFVE